MDDARMNKGRGIGRNVVDTSRLLKAGDYFVQLPVEWGLMQGGFPDADEVEVEGEERRKRRVRERMGGKQGIGYSGHSSSPQYSAERIPLVLSSPTVKRKKRAADIF